MQAPARVGGSMGPVTGVAAHRPQDGAGLTYQRLKHEGECTNRRPCVQAAACMGGMHTRVQAGGAHRRLGLRLALLLLLGRGRLVSSLLSGGRGVLHALLGQRHWPHDGREGGLVRQREEPARGVREGAAEGLVKELRAAAPSRLSCVHTPSHPPLRSRHATCVTKIGVQTAGDCFLLLLFSFPFVLSGKAWLSGGFPPEREGLQGSCSVSGRARGGGCARDTLVKPW
jgi:hypothetical protein